MGNHKVIDPQTVASAYPVVGARGHALPKRRSPSSPDSVAAQIARGIADVIAAGEISIADGVTLASILGRSRTRIHVDPETGRVTGIDGGASSGVGDPLDAVGLLMGDGTDASYFPTPASASGDGGSGGAFMDNFIDPLSLVSGDGGGRPNPRSLDDLIGDQIEQLLHHLGLPDLSRAERERFMGIFRGNPPSDRPADEVEERPGTNPFPSTTVGPNDNRGREPSSTRTGSGAADHSGLIDPWSDDPAPAPELIDPWASEPANPDAGEASPALIAALINAARVVRFTNEHTRARTPRSSGPGGLQTLDYSPSERLRSPSLHVPTSYDPDPNATSARANTADLARQWALLRTLAAGGFGPGGRPMPRASVQFTATGLSGFTSKNYP